MSHNPDLIRCGWVPPTDELYCHYHDTEWGIPNYDSKSLFSKLIQDGMQAGLAWITILRKRDSILEAFDDLDPDIIAQYTDGDRERLMNNAGIIRSKLKINAAISQRTNLYKNARRRRHRLFGISLGFRGRQANTKQLGQVLRCTSGKPRKHRYGQRPKETWI